MSMRNIVFEESDYYPVAILIKGTAFNKGEILRYYVEPLTQRGISQGDVVALTLAYNDTGKAPSAFQKDYLAELLPVLQECRTTHVYCADGNYFKTLTGVQKVDPHYGYALPCKIKGYEHLNIILGTNYQALIYNPDLKAKLELGLDTLASHKGGSYKEIGSDIIHTAHYPDSLEAIQKALNDLHQYPELSADIEGFNLRFDKCGIGTIAFAWDQHNGVAFRCDYVPCHDPNDPLNDHLHGFFNPNKQVRAMLKEFFTTYKGKITWHKAAYDVKVIIYTLWMENLLDRKGLLDGLHIMYRNIHDTRIIAYLATNSTAGNNLGLKTLAHEFAGNWAKDDIKDIRKIPLPELLRYNLVDTLSTNYVKDKYYPIMVQDQQEELYLSLMLPTQKLLTQMELVGMPMSIKQIAKVRAKLQKMVDSCMEVINTSPIIKALNEHIRQQKWEQDFEARKSKAKNPDKIKAKDLSAFEDEIFNPNSGPQKQFLLYELLGLPVIDLTDTKQPATGGDTLAKLVNHTEDPDIKALIQALLNYTQVFKILNDFIPKFEDGIKKAEDGIIWLHGNFNVGGTVSGRLSSSEPNMQNIPANVAMIFEGKEILLGSLIKECFEAPKGWLFCGADFNSLEDYISALLTKDPNKMAVYEQGFDGHALRAFYYFRDECPDIQQVEEGDRCFKVTDEKGKVHYIKCGTLVSCPDGVTRPVEEFMLKRKQDAMEEDSGIS